MPFQMRAPQPLQVNIRYWCHFPFVLGFRYCCLEPDQDDPAAAAALVAMEVAQERVQSARAAGFSQALLSLRKGVADAAALRP